VSDTEKSRIREQLLARRRSLSTVERERFSSTIQHTLCDQLDRSGIRHALIYRAMGDEVDTGMVLDSDGARAVYAPHTPHADHMAWLRIGPDTTWGRGSFGVMEPQAGETWTPDARPVALICPMTGFDRQGNRLGMGLGCFDRWLGEHRDGVDLLVGLAYACQEWPALPVEKHDMPLQLILTEREVIACPTN
jgi:5-formyltetrahydrofolate cyclo-ligase